MCNGSSASKVAGLLPPVCRYKPTSCTPCCTSGRSLNENLKYSVFLLHYSTIRVAIAHALALALIVATEGNVPRKGCPNGTSHVLHIVAILVAGILVPEIFGTLIVFREGTDEHDSSQPIQPKKSRGMKL